ncbi:MAG: type II toxin-antitoxin system RelE/ParE family toxin [Reyranella sp.]|uniref:type II toxin-antitoxin system RelE/ParE family toxin n=1 Tax=Reyranella sp. TaxID=1929291 RepID=UPI003D0D9C70
MVAMLTDQAGKDAAGRYRADIEGLFKRLAMFPRSGARRRALGRNARIGVISPYVVVYDLVDDEVLILRIVDGRRSISRRLIRDPQA